MLIPCFVKLTSYVSLWHTDITHCKQNGLSYKPGWYAILLYRFDHLW